jgi:hypothetical protein
VSLALHLAVDARADLRQLDVSQQEITFDELDRLARDPALISSPDPDGASVYSVEHAAGSKDRFVLTLILSYNERAKVLSLLGVTATSK